MDLIHFLVYMLSGFMLCLLQEDTTAKHFCFVLGLASSNVSFSTLPASSFKTCFADIQHTSELTDSMILLSSDGLLKRRLIV